MYRKIVLILNLCVGLALSAETVNLRGKVTNQDGKAIKGGLSLSWLPRIFQIPPMIRVSSNFLLR